MQAFGKILSGLLVLVVFVSFVMALMEALYPGPAYDDYFTKGRSEPPQEISTQAVCDAEGGKWFLHGTPERPKPVPVRPENDTGLKGEQPTGWCDLNFKAQEAYNKARAEHNRNSFLALMGLGIVSFLVASSLIYGSKMFSVAGAIEAGFALGGIILIVIGVARFWGEMNDGLRVGILGIMLVIIVLGAVFAPKIAKRTRVS